MSRCNHSREALQNAHELLSGFYNFGDLANAAVLDAKLDKAKIVQTLLAYKSRERIRLTVLNPLLPWTQKKQESKENSNLPISVLIDKESTLPSINDRIRLLLFGEEFLQTIDDLL